MYQSCPCLNCDLDLDVNTISKLKTNSNKTLKKPHLKAAIIERHRRDMRIVQIRIFRTLSQCLSSKAFMPLQSAALNCTRVMEVIAWRRKKRELEREVQTLLSISALQTRPIAAPSGCDCRFQKDANMVGSSPRIPTGAVRRPDEHFVWSLRPLTSTYNPECITFWHPLLGLFKEMIINWSCGQQGRLWEAAL